MEEGDGPPVLPSKILCHANMCYLRLIIVAVDPSWFF